jgi:hypothetical protein
LEIYIANIWPIGRNGTSDRKAANGDDGNNVPLDQDGAKNRLYDLKFHDKTPHEEKIAYLIRDYIDFATELKERAEASQVDISDILDKPGKSKNIVMERLGHTINLLKRKSGYLMSPAYSAGGS